MDLTFNIIIISFNNNFSFQIQVMNRGVLLYSLGTQYRVLTVIGMRENPLYKRETL